jgi:chromosome segregation ATPase
MDELEIVKARIAELQKVVEELRGVLKNRRVAMAEVMEQARVEHEINTMAQARIEYLEADRHEWYPMLRDMKCHSDQQKARIAELERDDVGWKASAQRLLPRAIKAETRIAGLEAAGRELLEERDYIIAEQRARIAELKELHDETLLEWADEKERQQARIEHLEARNEKLEADGWHLIGSRNTARARIKELEAIVEARDEQIRSLGGHI